MKTAIVAKKRRDECLERPTKLQKPNYFLNCETLAGKLSCKLLTLELHLKDRITLVQKRNSKLKLLTSLYYMILAFKTKSRS